MTCTGNDRLASSQLQARPPLDLVVLSAETVATDVISLELAAPDAAATARPGRPAPTSIFTCHPA